MAGMLTIKPEDEKRLHPQAIKWFNAQRAEIQFEVPLEELSDDDLNTFLSDDEKREFMRCKDEIIRGLATCINMDDASHDLVTNATIGLRLVKLQVNSLLPMRRISVLLQNVYQRKVAKAKQEQKERDEEDKRSREHVEAERKRKEEAAEAERRKNEADERWWAAYKELNIPADDAFRYLESEEHQEFVDSILGAVDAYLNKGKSYVLDRRANDYLAWISVINNRRKKEQEKIIANWATLALHFLASCVVSEKRMIHGQYVTSFSKTNTEFQAFHFALYRSSCPCQQHQSPPQVSVVFPVIHTALRSKRNHWRQKCQL